MSLGRSATAGPLPYKKRGPALFEPGPWIYPPPASALLELPALDLLGAAIAANVISLAVMDDFNRFTLRHLLLQHRTNHHLFLVALCRQHPAGTRQQERHRQRRPQKPLHNQPPSTTTAGARPARRPLILIDTPRGDEFPVSRAAPIPLANSESTQCSHDCRSAGPARMPSPWALAPARQAMLVGERVGPPCPDADSQKQRISVW